jgi:type I restriction enzyme S subunit
MHALLSIKPKHVESIIQGQKKYEFRKSIFKGKEIEKVYIYATSPTQRVVGTFMVGEIIKDHPRNLWSRLKGYSGLDELEFFSYFAGPEIGFAIQIKNVQEFEHPLNPRDFIPNFTPPQCFRYLAVDFFSNRPNV